MFTGKKSLSGRVFRITHDQSWHYSSFVTCNHRENYITDNFDKKALGNSTDMYFALLSNV